MRKQYNIIRIACLQLKELEGICGSAKRYIKAASIGSPKTVIHRALRGNRLDDRF